MRGKFFIPENLISRVWFFSAKGHWTVGFHSTDSNGLSKVWIGFVFQRIRIRIWFRIGFGLFVMTPQRCLPPTTCAKNVDYFLTQCVINSEVDKNIHLVIVLLRLALRI